MRRLFMLILLIGLLATPALAQTPNPAAECNLDAAQTWYDSLDENDIMQSAIVLAVSTDQKVTDRAKGGAALELFHGIVEKMEYPDCVTVAREQYLEAIEEMQTAAESIVNAESNSDYGLFAIQFGTAMESIGEFRGYLTAMGVEVYHPDDITMFFK